MHKTNHCFLVGNLGADPVQRGQSEKAGPIVGFSIAENVNTFDAETRTYKTVHTNWFNITAFGSMAERAKRHLKKGDRVAVQGRLQTTRYTDKSGESRSGFEIVADDISLWKPLPSANGGGEAPQRRARQAGGAETDLLEEESLPF
jgi:single-strand DNA-binding protein